MLIFLITWSLFTLTEIFSKTTSTETLGSSNPYFSGLVTIFKCPVKDIGSQTIV